MVTALDDAASRLSGIESGADDFTSKPFNRVELRARVRTITRLNRYRSLLEERASLEKAHSELLGAYDATIEGWVLALDLRDKETEGHSRRVVEMTVRMAVSAGIEGDALTNIRRGALLHDVGKLGVPDAVLQKPGRLTDEELVVMRKHPQYAHDMLSGIAYLRPALDIPYCHHEKWDGGGYPRGLKGEEIPLAARMFAIVDIWDALRSDRVYRPGLPAEKVIAQLREISGTELDPDCVDLFFRVVVDETTGMRKPALRD
jgi:putative two-component system response regulator